LSDPDRKEEKKKQKLSVCCASLSRCIQSVSPRFLEAPTSQPFWEMSSLGVGVLCSIFVHFSP
jgi:hypothetical protein